MNVPIDYAIELLNGEVKPDLKTKYGTLTHLTTECVGKSLKMTKEVESNVDIHTGQLSAMGRHKKSMFEDEVGLMVNKLKSEELFHKTAGRQEKGFRNFKRNYKMNWTKLESWLKTKIDVLARKKSLEKIINSYIMHHSHHPIRTIRSVKFTM